MSPLACRSCCAPLSTLFADLGATPIANALVDPASDPGREPVYPLQAFVCERCWLVQLGQSPPPGVHFNDAYPYFSAISESWLEHAKKFAQYAIDQLKLGQRAHVVEIGSNDGYLLQYFVQAGISCLGIDPAANCAKAAWEERRVKTEVAFFGAATATRLVDQGHCADLIVANNVLAHVPEINDFVAGVGILLKPSGTAMFEFPHLLELIRNVEFDTIYHEHYSYLSLLALIPLFSRHGLAIVDIERLATHGGSLRIHVRKAVSGVRPSRAVEECAGEEIAAGLNSIESYRGFDGRVRWLKQELVALLTAIKTDGKRIAGYGAPAKGNTLLNTCGIGREILDFTVDRSPHKQGMLLPGSRIPILAPDAIFERRPDYILILPWNIEREITNTLAGIHAWAGRFIVPIPIPTIRDAG